MARSDVLRAQLSTLLDWGEAHATFERVVADVPPEDRGVRAEGLPYSLWELLEHMRLAQRDMLEFCTREDYEEGTWPDDYWPPPPPPDGLSPSQSAWDESIAAFRADRAALQRIARDTSIDLFSNVPGGKRSYFSAIVLIADHTAYHLGQMIVLRRLLGNWER